MSKALFNVKRRMFFCTAAVMLSMLLLFTFCSDNSTGPNSDIIYSSFTDERDGKIYSTVKIGNKTWMAENLNYETDNSWCYGNNESNCDTYGRLYNWNAAMNACPAGWHLSTSEEWNDLISAANGSAKKLKSKTPDWNGTNELGFSALAGGERLSSFGNMDVHGYWWSAADVSNTDAERLSMGDTLGDNVQNLSRSKGYGFSVRCVKD